MSSKNNTGLIKKIAPKLIKGQYVFVSTNDPFDIPSEEIVCQFREKEGITLILEKSLADQKGYSYSFVAAWITLTVNSSLEEVGLTARVSAALTEECISCNAIAAYHHDHIFVPYRHADRAISILRKLD